MSCESPLRRALLCKRHAVSPLAVYIIICECRQAKRLHICPRNSRYLELWSLKRDTSSRKSHSLTTELYPRLLALVFALSTLHASTVAVPTTSSAYYTDIEASSHDNFPQLELQSLEYLTSTTTQRYKREFDCYGAIMVGKTAQVVVMAVIVAVAVAMVAAMVMVMAALEQEQEQEQVDLVREY